MLIGVRIHCRLIDAELKMSLKTVHLRALSQLNPPDCYQFDLQVCIVYFIVHCVSKKLAPLRQVGINSVIFQIQKIRNIRLVGNFLFALSLFTNKTMNNRMLFITERIRRRCRLIHCL